MRDGVWRRCRSRRAWTTSRAQHQARGSATVFCVVVLAERRLVAGVARAERASFERGMRSRGGLTSSVRGSRVRSGAVSAGRCPWMSRHARTHWCIGGRRWRICAPCRQIRHHDPRHRAGVSSRRVRSAYADTHRHHGERPQRGRARRVPLAPRARLRAGYGAAASRRERARRARLHGVGAASAPTTPSRASRLSRDTRPPILFIYQPPIPVTPHPNKRRPRAAPPDPPPTPHRTPTAAAAPGPPRPDPPPRQRGRRGAMMR